MFGELHAQFFLPSSINGIIFVTTLVKNVSEFLGWVVFHLISPILFSFLFRAAQYIPTNIPFFTSMSQQFWIKTKKPSKNEIAGVLTLVIFASAS